MPASKGRAAKGKPRPPARKPAGDALGDNGRVELYGRQIAEFQARIENLNFMRAANDDKLSDPVPGLEPDEDGHVNTYAEQAAANQVFIDRLEDAFPDLATRLRIKTAERDAAEAAAEA